VQQIKVNPNRMEVLRLKKRLSLGHRGHRLLKQKHDELIRILRDLVDETDRLRSETESMLKETFDIFLLARAKMGLPLLESIVETIQVEPRVEYTEKRILNLRVPEVSIRMEGDVHNYGFMWTNGDLDDALVRLQKAIESLLKLNAMERTLFLVAHEIEKTRRRVNALEHILIPQLENAIKRIIMKLEEGERADRVRLMKIKDMKE